MKRFQLFGAALLALLAFGALAAASASAITFLLAEWLVNGVAVTAELLTEITDEIIFIDLGTRTVVRCSFILDGWMGPNSLDYTTEVLSLSGGVINTTPLQPTGVLCMAQEGCSTSGETPTLWVLVPLESEVELVEISGIPPLFVRLDLPVAAGKGPGWVMECSVLGIKAEDECTASEEVSELTLEGTSLLNVSSKEFTELAGAKLANCTLGGSEEGVVEGGGLYSSSVGGGELTVSSEGVSS